MTGPSTETEAKLWVQNATKDGRYVTSAHFWQRAQQRGLTIEDVFEAIENATKIETYSCPLFTEAPVGAFSGPTKQANRLR